MFGEDELQELLDELRVGIDHGKRVVTATHSFHHKIDVLGQISIHLTFTHEEHEVSEILHELQEELCRVQEISQELEKEELHVVLQEKAALASGNKWILAHASKIDEEFRIQEHLAQKFLHHLYDSTRLASAQLSQTFSYDDDQQKKEIENITKEVLSFLETYEHLFAQEIKRLEAAQKV